MRDQTQSPVHALLALPAIGGGGVEQSIVFANLPEQVQSLIRAAQGEQAKREIAARAGDELPLVAEMYEHYVRGPAERANNGQPFPGLERMSDFPLPGVLNDCDQHWLRPGQAVRLIENAHYAGVWNVLVHYADGEVRCANATALPYAQQASAEQRISEVQRAAYVLGLVSTEPESR